MKRWCEMGQTQFVVTDAIVVREKIEIFKPLWLMFPFHTR